MSVDVVVVLTPISIHAPARGATKKYKLIEIEDVNFNPRSREGSDRMMFPDFRFVHISIHAPARGATEDIQRHVNAFTISIHAPARGATAFIDIFSFTVRLYFISSH